MSDVTHELVRERASDLRVKFDGCYGKLGSYVIKASTFNELTTDTSEIVYLRYTKGGREERRTEQFTTAFDFTLPKLGAINFKDYSLFVERLHKRSSPSRYRKGLCSDTVEVLNPNSVALELLHISTPFLNFSRRFGPSEERIFRSLMYDLFFPTELSFEEAMYSVLSMSRISAAFSHSLTVSMNLSVDKFVLSKNNWVIGLYNEKSKVFEMLLDTFNEELDLLGVPFIPNKGDK
jgi:hypothetical protein